MKINLSISKRIDLQGRSEIMLLIRRRLGNKVIDIRAKSGIFIDPKMFDYNKKVVKVFAANKLQTEEVLYHNSQLKKLDILLARINESYVNERDKSNVCGKWLENIVNSTKNGISEIKGADIYSLFQSFLSCKTCTKGTLRNLISVIRSVERFEAFVRETDSKRKDYIFDVRTVTKEDIENYRHYIIHEKELSERLPNIFEKILSGRYRYRNIKARGHNSSYKIMKNLKSFFMWLEREKIVANNPFNGIVFGTEKYGTPYYLTNEERDIIASTDMPTTALEAQRDIFVFQCLTGCRVSDLMKFTKSNITDNILIYTPRKTKDDGMQSLQARVPLHEKAIKLIKRYNGIDKRGRLFPFISCTQYNNAIKSVLTISNITRMVEVRNTFTGEIESRPINEIASSHLARRTFIGNLYSKVADPNLIGKMSGHVDGSKAFARYRKIEDETLKNVIDLL